MVDRNHAWGLLVEFTPSESLRRHAMAVEACMRAPTPANWAETRGNGA
jgi:predicted hydrolase (HD superfamily)